MKIVSIEERVRVLNTTGKCLVMYPLLVPPGRKVCPVVQVYFEVRWSLNLLLHKRFSKYQKEIPLEKWKQSL